MDLTGISLERLPPRKKILRRPDSYKYPLMVCTRCGMYASEDSKTRVEEIILYDLAHCDICQDFTNVTHPSDFGYPTFYTFENGEPVKRGAS